jgi:hypothetical protein
MAKALKELKNPWFCPECGREFELQGRSGHLRFVHNVLPSQLSAFLENAATPVVNPPRPLPAGTQEPATQTITTVENNQEVEMTTQSKEEKHEIGCPGCRKHEYREVDLERDVELRDRTIAELKAQLANQAPAEVKQAYPTVEDFVDHCESGSCSVHKQEWDAVKAKIIQSTIDNLPGEALPDKIVESEGLRRGFIPTKIVIH